MMYSFEPIVTSFGLFSLFWFLCCFLLLLFCLDEDLTLGWGE